MQWGEPLMLAWLWVLPLVAMLGVYALVRRKAALRRFAGTVLGPRLVSGGGPGLARAVLKWSMLVLALGCIVVALARPRFNLPGEDAPKKPTERTGRDVCFIIDVSRSMLAEDLRPSRLERAKLWVKDVLEVVRGDRVAVMAFAGVPVVKCPLTHDYAYARLSLEELSPTSVTRGGTNLGDAVRVALTEVFELKDDKPVEANYRDIILITDGEDQENSSPVEAAEKAGQLGVRLITIGLGDDTSGARVPTTDDRGRRTFVTDGNQEVYSKLDADTLQKMALATPGGVFLRVGVGTVELDEIYKGLIDKADKRKLGNGDDAEQYEERFQWPLGAALALLSVEMLVGERRKWKRA